MLRAAGLAVERHGDHFAHDCPDEKWLETIGRKGWVAITHDGRIRYKQNELAAVMAHDVALLVIIGHAPYPQLAQAFVASTERVGAFLYQHTPPFIAKVYRASSTELVTNPQAPGRIDLWHPVDAIKRRVRLPRQPVRRAGIRVRACMSCAPCGEFGDVVIREASKNWNSTHHWNPALQSVHLIFEEVRAPLVAMY